MDGCEPQVEEEMSYCCARVVECWCVFVLFVFHASIDESSRLRLGLEEGKGIHISGLMHFGFLEFLQSRLDEEVAEPGFSRLPFRYAEVSKVLLDV